MSLIKIISSVVVGFNYSFDTEKVPNESKSMKEHEGVSRL